MWALNVVLTTYENKSTSCTAELEKAAAFNCRIKKSGSMELLVCQK
jgi:hypothetical protein